MLFDTQYNEVSLVQFKTLSDASWFMYIPVVLFAICIILSSITTIVGWVSLRKKKVVSA